MNLINTLWIISEFEGYLTFKNDATVKTVLIFFYFNND